MVGRARLEVVTERQSQGYSASSSRTRRVGFSKFEKTKTSQVERLVSKLPRAHPQQSLDEGRHLRIFGLGAAMGSCFDGDALVPPRATRRAPQDTARSTRPTRATPTP